MLTFLFWNINKRDRRDALARLVRRHDIDVLVLAESALKPGDVLNTLNSSSTVSFHFNFGRCQRISVYSAFATEQLPEIRAEDRFTIRHLRLPMRTDVLLAAAHLPSKLHQPEESLKYSSLDFAYAIRSVEKDVGHERTLAMGDFNMEPFDSAMVSAKGFHAVMARKVAKSGDGARQVEGERYPFFYNPMWSLLGDASPGPAGTFYLPGQGHVTYFWHMPDQVLLRPELLKHFRNQDLEILTDDGQTDFLKKRSGAPNPQVGSDHLPLLVRIDL